VAAALFSLLGAMNGRFVVQSLVLLITFFVLFLLVANAVRDKRDVAVLLGSLLASVSLVSLYGLLQYLGLARGPGDGVGLGQVISTLGNKEYIAGLLAYALVPAVILLVRLRSVALRVLVIALIAFNFGSLMLFEQTGANVALAVAVLAVVVGIVIFRPIAPLRRARLWLIALLAVLAFAYLVEAPSGPLNSVVGLSAESGSWISQLWARNSGAARAWDWWVGIEMWKSSPWVGIGLGNYKLQFIPFKAQFLSTPAGAQYDFHIARAAQAHNEYVQVLAELGILGALALAALLATLAVSMILRLVRNRDEDDRLDLLLLAGGLVALVVHAFVSFPAHLPASSLAAILILALCHSRAYGNDATKEFTLRGRGLRATVVAGAVVGIVVSTIAVRDLAADILMREGSLRLKLGDAAAAQTLLEKSLRLEFAPHQTYFYLGMAQAQQGNIQAAFDSFTRCRTRFLDENTYLIYAELASNLGKTKEADEALDVLLASRPSRDVKDRARYVQAATSLRKGDNLAAVQELESLVADSPNFELGGMLYGSVLAAQGSRDRARQEYQRVLQVIDKKLAAAEKTLAAKTRMTATEYSELRTSINALRAERDTVNERMKALGTP